MTKPTYSFGTLRKLGFKSLDFSLLHASGLCLCSSDLALLIKGMNFSLTQRRKGAKTQR